MIELFGLLLCGLALYMLLAEIPAYLEERENEDRLNKYK